MPPTVGGPLLADLPPAEVTCHPLSQASILAACRQGLYHVCALCPRAEASTYKVACAPRVFCMFREISHATHLSVQGQVLFQFPDLKPTDYNYLT